MIAFVLCPLMAQFWKPPRYYSNNSPRSSEVLGTLKQHPTSVNATKKIEFAGKEHNCD